MYCPPMERAVGRTHNSTHWEPVVLPTPIIVSKHRHLEKSRREREWEKQRQRQRGDSCELTIASLCPFLMDCFSVCYHSVLPSKNVRQKLLCVNNCLFLQVCQLLKEMINHAIQNSQYVGICSTISSSSMSIHATFLSRMPKQSFDLLQGHKEHYCIWPLPHHCRCKSFIQRHQPL